MKLKILAVVFAMAALVSCSQIIDTPSETEPVTHTVSFHGFDGNLIAEKQVEHGKSVEPPETDRTVRTVEYLYTFTGWDTPLDSVESDLSVNAEYRISDKGFPDIKIFTEKAAPVVSKEDYVVCSVTVSNTADEYCINKSGAKIRCRGNSTFYLDKKPYRLKFDEKTDLFGNGKAKDWLLIANHADQSQIRNYTVYTLGAMCDDLKYTTSVQFCNLYINREYLGVYLVCEQVEAGKNRVNIEKDSAEPDTGFLIELDMHVYDEGNTDRYITVDNCPYVIKSPDKDEISAEQTQYIKRYLEKTVWALKRGNYSDVCKYIDVTTFADGYIIHELSHTLDSGYSSYYMYKDKGGLLCCGPLWDFDVSMGNCNWEPRVSEPKTLYAAEVSPWYRQLLQFDEFKALVGEKIEKYAPQFRDKINSIADTAQSREKLFMKNDEKWHTIGTWVWPNTRDIARLKTFTEHTDYVRNFLLSSLSNLEKVYTGK